MAWWQRQAGKTTRNRVISLLRRGQRSVEELAEALGITDNAVRAQLAALQREKVVQAIGVRRDGAVGKPATVYGMATDSSALFSSAYAPVLVALLAELGEHMTARQVGALLRRSGRRLARFLPERTTFDERVRASATFLPEMGADSGHVRRPRAVAPRGHRWFRQGTLRPHRSAELQVLHLAGSRALSLRALVSLRHDGVRENRRSLFRTRLSPGKERGTFLAEDDESIEDVGPVRRLELGTQRTCQDRPELANLVRIEIAGIRVAGFEDVPFERIGRRRGQRSHGLTSHTIGPRIRGDAKDKRLSFEVAADVRTQRSTLLLPGHATQVLGRMTGGSPHDHLAVHRQVRHQPSKVHVHRLIAIVE